eukprot:365357-Chlamydomonas_euryale.AAC.4
MVFSALLCPDLRKPSRGATLGLVLPDPKFPTTTFTVLLLTMPSTLKPRPEPWNLYSGTCILEPALWNLYCGTCAVEPGTWNLKPGTCTCNMEHGSCNLEDSRLRYLNPAR